MLNWIKLRSRSIKLSYIRCNSSRTSCQKFTRSALKSILISEIGLSSFLNSLNTRNAVIFAPSIETRP